MATLYFSHDSASIATVIPAMDTLTNTLNPDTKESYHPSILAAMTLAWKKMNRYYLLTDDLASYRIVMGKTITPYFYIVTHVISVLHPGLKLEYFCQHKWEEVDWAGGKYGVWAVNGYCYLLS